VDRARCGGWTGGWLGGGERGDDDCWRMMSEMGTMSEGRVKPAAVPSHVSGHLLHLFLIIDI
jgi:hypothetical protein